MIVKVEHFATSGASLQPVVLWIVLIVELIDNFAAAFWAGHHLSPSTGCAALGAMPRNSAATFSISGM